MGQIEVANIYSYCAGYELKRDPRIWGVDLCRIRSIHDRPGLVQAGGAMARLHIQNATNRASDDNPMSLVLA